MKGLDLTDITLIASAAIVTQGMFVAYYAWRKKHPAKSKVYYFDNRSRFQKRMESEGFVKDNKTWSDYLQGFIPKSPLPLNPNDEFERFAATQGYVKRQLNQF